jgi:hypothetical protein
MPAAVAALLLLSVLTRSADAVIVACPPASLCASDADCALNGVCTSGVCVCDGGWTGHCCGQLDLAPVDFAATNGGYREPLTSTWGGNVVQNGSTYHMWIAEMTPAHADGTGSCGLTTWSSNSQITHVSSYALAGPYAREEVAVTAWSHNPIVRRMPDSTYVLFHIGDGGAPANATPPKGFCALNGTSPCGEQSFDKCGPQPANNACNATPAGWMCSVGTCMGAGGNCGTSLAEPTLRCDDTYATCVPAAAAACAATPGCAAFSLSPVWESGLTTAKLFGAGLATTPNAQWSSWTRAGVKADNDGGSCTLRMHTAPSTAGPWTPFTNATITPCGSNNPGPYVHPNGTVFIIFTDQGMGLWRADDWRGPYMLVTTGACGGGEDPSLFIDARGHFHCLFHRSPFSDPDIAIGHSWSHDGYAWTTAAEPAANSTIAAAGGAFGGRIVHGKRERPHVYVDADGRLRAFVSGVGLVPACNPMGPLFNASADCSATAQYPLIDSNSPDGWYDSTYTSVQEVF